MVYTLLLYSLDPYSVTLFYSTLFCCGGKVNLVQFTLFYSTLLTLTDRRKDRQRNEYTRFAWAGGTVWRVRNCYYNQKKKVLVLCLAGARSLLRLEKKSSSRLSGRCAIVITTGEKKSSSRLSGGCAIFIMTGKKKIHSSVWRVRDCYYDRKKIKF